MTAVETLLESKGNSRFNLVIGIKDPVVLTPSDERICALVDSFFRSNASLPLITVANTIFPGGFYRDGGAQAVYEEFPASYELTKEGWGTYAGRLFHDKVEMKGGNGPICRIERLVAKLRTNANAIKMRASYEADILDTIVDEDVSTYQAGTDAGLGIGQPCLAHLSFKLHADMTVSLTAVYRSQYYVAKALGNFIGLGQLLAFVAAEADLRPGYLVCHATLAELDLCNSKARWTKKSIGHLIRNCRVAAADIREAVNAAY
jgi:hypothetical protein